MPSVKSQADLKHAIALIKSGEKAQARKLLKEILLENPADDRTWAWFIQTLSTDRERWIVLEGLLKINPRSVTARRYMDEIRQRNMPTKLSQLQAQPVTDQAPGRALEEDIPRTCDEGKPIEPAAHNVQKVEPLSEAGTIRESSNAQTPATDAVHPNINLGRPKPVHPKRKGLVAFVVFLGLAGVVVIILLAWSGDLGDGFFINSNKPECLCRDAEAYLRRISQRVERWKTHQTISYFAALQGDINQEIDYAQHLYDEETNENVPSCMEAVHDSFLLLLSNHLKYAKAIKGGNMFNAELYYEYEKDRQLELRDVLSQYSHGYDCVP